MYKRNIVSPLSLRGFLNCINMRSIHSKQPAKTQRIDQLEDKISKLERQLQALLDGQSKLKGAEALPHTTTSFGGIS